MKPFLVIALSLFLTAFSYAEEPAPKIEGLAGIPFGSSADQVKAEMDSRGAAFHPKASSGAHLEFQGGSFHNEAAYYWGFDFLDGALYRVSVSLNPGNRQHLNTYERIRKLISDKYGKPFQETKIEMDLGELYELVRNGKAVLETDWKSVDPGSRSIVCKLICNSGGKVVVRIIYQDDVVAAKISRKQQDDL